MPLEWIFRTGSVAYAFALVLGLSACTHRGASSSSARPAAPLPQRPVSPTMNVAAAGSVVPEPASSPVDSVDAPTQPAVVRVTCQELEDEAKRETERRLEEMRRQMRAELAAWRAAQPMCGRDGEPPDRNRGSPRDLRPMRLSAGSRPSGPQNTTVNLSATDQPQSTRMMAKSSRTNSQVQGVDEADIVKTDGRYLYLALNGALRIVATKPPNLVSTIKLPGIARELLVQGDRAAVFVSHGTARRQRCTYGYDCTISGDGRPASLFIYDIKDRKRPILVRWLEFSSSLVAARSIGSTVHAVVTAAATNPPERYSTWPEFMPRCGVSESLVELQLRLLERKNEELIRRAPQWHLPALRDNGVDQPLCEGLFTTSADQKSAFTTVVSVDISEDQTPVRSATIRSNPGPVYVAPKSVYMATSRDPEPSSTAGTQLHRFEIGERVDLTRYLGSGVIPGRVLNQLSMDEWRGNLRVASTVGRVPSRNVENVLSILSPTSSGNLDRVGAVQHLAPGEDIRSVKFDGPRAYVVTFKKTDPLFVLDLERPEAPRLLGELKIPGFSTYMHRIDPTHLFSIGFEANDRGNFALFDGVALQLFDVSDPVRPRLLHKELIGTRGTSSEAATDHLAFNYFPEKNLVGVPMTICEGGGQGRVGRAVTFSGLLVYRVSTEEGFRRLGGISHGTSGQSCGTWWSRSTSRVKRSVFIDDLVVSIASDRVKIQRSDALGRDVADINLL